MDNGKFAEETLKNILSSFIDSYAKRDKSIGFSEWLEDKLLQEMPDMTKEAGKKLAGEIIEAVADYDKTLDDLNRAIDAGQSKEEWFSEQMAESYADMPFDAVGDKLQQIENDFSSLNIELIREIDNTQVGGESIADNESVEWNEYSVKSKIHEIGKQIMLSGMAAAANAIKDKIQDGESVGIGDIVKETFQDGLKKDSGEVKAAVAGAVKVAAQKGLADILPTDTPTEIICDMAGAAVEGAEALFDAANGERTITEALDKIFRAVIVAGCRYSAKLLNGVVLSVPFGPILVDLLDGLFEHMEQPKFIENVYTVIRDAAVATWEGIKESRFIRSFERMKNKLLN